MAYYITNKTTNKINPNVITGEVALFKIEQDFINAKQQWIVDNTIINELTAFDKNGVFIEVAPNNSVLQQNLATLPLEYEIIDDVKNIKPAPDSYEINADKSLYIEIATELNTKYIQTILPNDNDYQYRPITEKEKEQIIKDLFDYKLSKEKDENIIVTQKHPLYNMSQTWRMPVEDYINGEIQEEVNNIEFNVIKQYGQMLQNFLNEEKDTNQHLAEVDKIKNIFGDNTLLTDDINYLKAKAIEIGEKNIRLKEIVYLVYDYRKPINSETKFIPMLGFDFEGTYKQMNIMATANSSPVSIISVDGSLEVFLPIETVINANTDLCNIYTNQGLLFDQYSSHINNKCETVEDIEKALLSIEDVKNSDVDLVKDGKISILVSNKNMTVYDNTLSWQVKVNSIGKTEKEQLAEKEKTNITSMILNFE